MPLRAGEPAVRWAAAAGGADPCAAARTGAAARRRADDRVGPGDVRRGRTCPARGRRDGDRRDARPHGGRYVPAGRGAARGARRPRRAADRRDDLGEDLSTGEGLTSTKSPAPPRTAAPVPGPGARPARWGVGIATIAVLVWAVHGAGLSVGELVAGRDGARELLSGFLSPDLSGEFLATIGGAIVQTTQISLAGLLLAAIVGMPFAVLLARNVEAPAPVRGAVRLSAAFLRGVPDLLWALLFVAMIGPGPAAGALAVALHGAGMLAKLGAEQLEAVKPGPIEALRLVGANRTSVALLGVVPEARANLASLLLYQWECNVRTSTVLGFVGAGGIGQELAVSLTLFRYDELSTLVLAVLALILAVDLLSRLIRRRLGAVA
ncbi:MAG: phosphonate ABC transporter, permease protein PhnE [Streptosporangiales bacterium]|nr:phosphonate ABC transporter, permease protein PhnE [Streptosporangiales bacterium]